MISSREMDAHMPPLVRNAEHDHVSTITVGDKQADQEVAARDMNAAAMSAELMQDLFF